VRRIEALTGSGAVTHLQSQRESLDRLLGRLNVSAAQAPDVVDRLQADVKRLQREVSQLRLKAAMGGGGQTPTDDAVTVGGVQVLTRVVADLDKTALRELADSLKDKLGTAVVILGAHGDGKVSFVVSVTKNVVDRVHAGKLVKRPARLRGGRRQAARETRGTARNRTVVGSADARELKARADGADTRMEAYDFHTTLLLTRARHQSHRGGSAG
jgi:alanyl-tRNA synthetase